MPATPEHPQHSWTEFLMHCRRLQTATDPTTSGMQKALQSAAMGQPSPPAQEPRVSVQQANDKLEAAAYSDQEDQAASSVMPEPSNQLDRAALGQPSASEIESTPKPKPGGSAAAPASRQATPQKRDLTPRPFFAPPSPQPQQPQPASAQRPAAQQRRDLKPRPFFATSAPPTPPPQSSAQQQPPAAEQRRDLTPRSFFDSPAPTKPAQAAPPQRAPAAEQRRDLTPKAFFASPAPPKQPAQPAAPQRPPAEQKRDLTPRAFFATPTPSAPQPPQQQRQAQPPQQQQRPAPQQRPPSSGQSRDLTPRPFFDSPKPTQAVQTSAPSPQQTPKSEQRRDLTPRPFFSSLAPAAASSAKATAQQPPPKSFSPVFDSRQDSAPAAAAKAQQGPGPVRDQPAASAGMEASEKLPPTPPLAGHAEQAAALQAIHEKSKGRDQAVSPAQSSPPSSMPSAGFSGSQMDDEVQARPQQQQQPAASEVKQDDDMSGPNAPQKADPSLPDTYALGQPALPMIDVAFRHKQTQPQPVRVRLGWDTNVAACIPLQVSIQWHANTSTRTGKVPCRNHQP